MDNINSFYILKDEILKFIPLKKFLQLFKYNKKYQKLFDLEPKIYELYNNIQKGFEPFNENYQNEMLSYIPHLTRIQKNISNDVIIKYYFHFLLSQKRIYAEYNNIYFPVLLEYLNSKEYSGTLILKLEEPKLDLDKRPNIEIKNQNFFLDIYFHMKWIDREKKENIIYFKKFLDEKIIGENTKNKVNKIIFFEDLNLNEEKYENFFFDELYEFPNALFNIQSNYFDDNIYWSQLDRFSQLKLIINEIIKENEIDDEIINNNINKDINNISNTKTKDFENENIIIEKYKDIEYISKINNLNENILSIRELNNFILDFRKNKINIASEFLNAYFLEDKNLKNKLPTQLTLINFSYEKNKEYFSEFNNKVNNLTIIQRIYKYTPYPFYLSPNIQCLKVLKLERINILEENLVLIIKNNPLLEIFEIHKNYTGYIFGYNLAFALSNLNFLKSLMTESFWFKENIPNFICDDLINKQENEFYKFFKSKSLIDLRMDNETNISIKTLNENLPNLIHLSIENSNILRENDNNNTNTIQINSDSNSIRNRYKKKLSEKLNSRNNNDNKLNHSRNDKLFNNLRDLYLGGVKNIDEFIINMATINTLEDLSLDYFEPNFFNTLLKYGKCFTNLDALYIYPKLDEKIIKSIDMINFVKDLHFFQKITSLTICFFYINENLVNTLYDELIQLPLLYKLKIYVKNSSEEEKELIKNKINGIKNRSLYKDFFTITYIFLDKKFF